jgi:phosphoribosyl 1,2-cyclic phosphodiesterase
MAATLCTIASSSRGNATAIAFDDSGRFVLVDAGISPKRVREGIAQSGSIASFQRLRAIFLTHLDTDHWTASWAAQMRRHPVPVIVRREHEQQALDAGVPRACLRVMGGEFRLGDAAMVRAVAVAHDEAGSTAYRFDCENDGTAIGHATDLGCVDDDLLEAFAGIDLLSIESNYDEAMQIRSPRPDFLKRRIMGDAGHLSNEQSACAVEALARAGEIAHLTLLHLSQECNTPELARRAVEARVKGVVGEITVSSPTAPMPAVRFARCAGKR